MRRALRAPFPWFGGKARVAPNLWRASGPSVADYVEPVAGSPAVPDGRQGGPGHHPDNQINLLERIGPSLHRPPFVRQRALFGAWLP